MKRRREYSYVNNQNYSDNSYNNYDNYNTQQYNNYGNNEYSNYENNNSYNNYENYNYDPNLSDEYYDDTQNEFYEEEPEEQKPKKNLFLISSLSALAILLVAGGAYFGYTKFIKESKQTVDLSQYEIEFSPYGENLLLILKKFQGLKQTMHQLKISCKIQQLLIIKIIT